jgi:hypothetical protein
MPRAEVRCWVTDVDPTLEAFAALRLLLDAYADLLIVATDLLERAAAADQLTPGEVQVYRSKFASAEAGSECLKAQTQQMPRPPSASC